MEKQEIKKRLEKLKQELAQTEKKLQKSDKKAKVKEHVKRKIQEHQEKVAKGPFSSIKDSKVVEFGQRKDISDKRKVSFCLNPLSAEEYGKNQEGKDKTEVQQLGMTKLFTPLIETKCIEADGNISHQKEDEHFDGKITSENLSGKSTAGNTTEKTLCENVSQENIKENLSISEEKREKVSEENTGVTQPSEEVVMKHQHLSKHKGQEISHIYIEPKQSQKFRLRKKRKKMFDSEDLSETVVCASPGFLCPIERKSSDSLQTNVQQLELCANIKDKEKISQLESSKCEGFNSSPLNNIYEPGNSQNGTEIIPGTQMDRSLCTPGRLKFGKKRIKRLSKSNETVSHKSNNGNESKAFEKKDSKLVDTIELPNTQEIKERTQGCNSQTKIASSELLDEEVLIEPSKEFRESLLGVSELTSQHSNTCAEQKPKRKRSRKSDIDLLDFSFLDDEGGHDMYSQVKSRRRKTRSFAKCSQPLSQNSSKLNKTFESQPSQTTKTHSLPNLLLPKCLEGLSQFSQSEHDKTYSGDSDRSSQDSKIQHLTFPILTKSLLNIFQKICDFSLPEEEYKYLKEVKEPQLKDSSLIDIQQEIKQNDRLKHEVGTVQKNQGEELQSMNCLTDVRLPSQMEFKEIRRKTAKGGRKRKHNILEENQELSGPKHSDATQSEDSLKGKSSDCESLSEIKSVQTFSVESDTSEEMIRKKTKLTNSPRLRKENVAVTESETKSSESILVSDSFSSEQSNSQQIAIKNIILEEKIDKKSKLKVRRTKKRKSHCPREVSFTDNSKPCQQIKVKTDSSESNVQENRTISNPVKSIEVSNISNDTQEEGKMLEKNMKHSVTIKDSNTLGQETLYLEEDDLTPSSEKEIHIQSLNGVTKMKDIRMDVPEQEVIISMDARIYPQRKDHRSILIVCTQTTLQIWTEDRNEEWVMSYRKSNLKNEYKAVYLLPHQTIIAVACVRAGGSIKVFGFESPNETWEFNLNTTLVANDPTVIFKAESGKEAYVAYCTSRHTDIKKYIFDNEIKETTIELKLSSVGEEITSLALVEALPLALLGISRKQIYLWNHGNGLLLKKIENLWGIFQCLSATSEQGLLFMSTMDTSTPYGGLKALNPSNDKCVQINRFNLNTESSKADRLVSGFVDGESSVCVDNSGNVLMWDIYSGRMTAFIGNNNGKHYHSVCKTKATVITAEGKTVSFYKCL